MQNVIHIAPNACQTAQNDGWMMQNDGRTMHNVGCNTLNICQGPKGVLEEPPRGPPTPILEKTLVSRTQAQLSYKIGGAKNNSAPFDLNLAILEVFSYKASPQKGPISILFYPFLLLTDPIKILIFLQQIAMICSNLPFYSLNMPPQTLNNDCLSHFAYLVNFGGLLVFKKPIIK